MSADYKHNLLKFMLQAIIKRRRAEWRKKRRARGEASRHHFMCSHIKSEMRERESGWWWWCIRSTSHRVLSFHLRRRRRRANKGWKFTFPSEYKIITHFHKYFMRYHILCLLIFIWTFMSPRRMSTRAKREIRSWSGCQQKFSSRMDGNENFSPPSSTKRHQKQQF